MIIVDRELQRRAEAKDPIRVAVLGAGFFAKGLAKILSSTAGMRLVAVANRTIENARGCLTEAAVGAHDIVAVELAAECDRAIAAGKVAVTAQPTAVTRAEFVDVLIEATGTADYAAYAVLDAIEHGKHVIVNAELDGTVGPILKIKADRRGVIFSGGDGDQPAAQMNLVRYVRGIGMEPLLCGNVKGLEDHYRTPETQQGFANSVGFTPVMATNFADGSKISFEQAVTANATGMCVARRGMLGYEHRSHVDELTTRYNIDELRAFGGIVEYVIGAAPGPGIFVLAAATQAWQPAHLRLYKMGDGPLYSFYTPFHLCHFEMPFTVARVVLRGDAALAPLAGPRVEVVATAKRDLKVGEILDQIGGFTVFGQTENAHTVADEDLLPVGVAEGCRLTRPVPKDAVLTYSDVEVPSGRLIDRLRDEQAQHFGLERAGRRRRRGEIRGVVSEDERARLSKLSAVRENS